jgi:hypothetical protein
MHPEPDQRLASLQGCLRAVLGALRDVQRRLDERMIPETPDDRRLARLEQEVRELRAMAEDHARWMRLRERYPGPARYGAGMSDKTVTAYPEPPSVKIAPSWVREEDVA